MKNLLLFFSILSISCSSPKGYTNYQDLFKTFPSILRADDAAIKKFCEDIIPDEGTYAYMENNHMSYRHIPENKKDEPEIINELRGKYEEQIKDFIQDLKDDATLANFQFDKIVREGTVDVSGEVGGKNVQATETFCNFKSGEKKYECKLGELICINGVWKTFTSGKFWRIHDK